MWRGDRQSSSWRSGRLCITWQEEICSRDRPVCRWETTDLCRYSPSCPRVAGALHYSERATRVGGCCANPSYLVKRPHLLHSLVFKLRQLHHMTIPPPAGQSPHCTEHAWHQAEHPVWFLPAAKAASESKMRGHCVYCWHLESKFLNDSVAIGSSGREGASWTAHVCTWRSGDWRVGDGRSPDRAGKRRWRFRQGFALPRLGVVL